MKHIFNWIKTNKIIVIVGGVLLVAAITVWEPADMVSTNFYMTSGQSAGYAAPLTRSVAAKAEYAMADMEIEMDESMMYPEPPRAGGEAEYDQSLERRLIKNGSLSMVVTDMSEAREQVASVVLGHEGFVANQQFNDGNRYHSGQEWSVVSGSMTLRIPNDRFEPTMRQLRDIALVVTSDSSHVNDVTEQYRDLEIRLENKKAEEERYRALLARATDISDVLEVTKYMEQARTQTERLEGQLNVLVNQVDLSTVTVYLESERPYQIGGITWDPWGQVQQSWRNLLSGLTGLVDRAISLVIYLPLIALYAVLYGGMGYALYRIGRRIYQRIRK